MSLDGATVAVVGAGYEGKRRAYARLAELGVRAVLLDEPGHWSESLGSEGLVDAWLPAPIVGDADRDATTRPGGHPARRRVDVLGGQRVRGRTCRRRSGTSLESAGCG